MAAKEASIQAPFPQVVRGADLDRRAVLYSRVSTLHHGQDPEVQSREIREYCQRRGWPLVGEYVDAGVSGAKERRPRLARSVSHLLRALENFRSLGIEFVSLSEQVDTSTPTGKMIFTVLGAVAELERSLIVERVKAGLRNARAKGRKLGRPAKQVNAAQIAALRAQGVPWRRIGAQLGVSPATAYAASKGRL